MKILFFPLVFSLLVLKAHAQDAHAFSSKSIAALTVAKGEFSSSSVTLRTAKSRGMAHGHEVLMWAECVVKIETTHFGSVKLVSVNHRGAYQWRNAKFELPNDILSALAQPKGVLNRLGIEWYQGAKANLSRAHYTTVMKQAGEALKNINKLNSVGREFKFTHADNQTNHKAASKALKLIGGVNGLNTLMRACGTPQGLDLRNVDMNLMLY